MNHIPKLHGALTRHLKELALAKQSEGYYGDGLWSAGRSLAGGDFVSGLGMQQKQDNLLPEHVCGGAFSRTRAGRRTAGSKRRRRSAAAPGSRKFKGPSLHTGAQTAANTRGGNRRVQLDVDTTASGTRVDGRNHIPGATAKSAEYKLDSNSTFRKRTQSREARAKRANAALARFAQAASATGVKAEDDTKVNVKHEGDLRAAFSRQSSRATPTPGPSRRAPDEVELKAEAEYSSGTASDTDSNTEGEGSDADLVGNDLPGEVSANGNDGDRYTQGWRETAEQRRRRMTRFDDRQRGASEGNTLSRNDANEWSELLEDTSRSGETRTTQDNSAANAGASEKRPRLDIDTGSPDQDSNDSDNEIVFVAQQPGTGARSGEKGRQQDGQSATACASTSLTPAPENVAQTAHTSPIHRSDRTTTKVDRAAADTADWSKFYFSRQRPRGGMMASRSLFVVPASISVPSVHFEESLGPHSVRSVRHITRQSCFGCLDHRPLHFLMYKCTVVVPLQADYTRYPLTARRIYLDRHVGVPRRSAVIASCHNSRHRRRRRLIA